MLNFVRIFVGVSQGLVAFAYILGLVKRGGGGMRASSLSTPTLKFFPMSSLYFLLQKFDEPDRTLVSDV